MTQRKVYKPSNLHIPASAVVLDTAATATGPGVVFDYGSGNINAINMLPALISMPVQPYFPVNWFTSPSQKVNFTINLNFVYGTRTNLQGNSGIFSMGAYGGTSDYKVLVEIQNLTKTIGESRVNTPVIWNDVTGLFFTGGYLYDFNAQGSYPDTALGYGSYNQCYGTNYPTYSFNPNAIAYMVTNPPSYFNYSTQTQYVWAASSSYAQIDQAIPSSHLPSSFCFGTGNSGIYQRQFESNGLILGNGSAVVSYGYDSFATSNTNNSRYPGQFTPAGIYRLVDNSTLDRNGNQLEIGAIAVNGGTVPYQHFPPSAGMFRSLAPSVVLEYAMMRNPGNFNMVLNGIPLELLNTYFNVSNYDSTYLQ